MYLEHITTFLNLAETLNFSKTAINMHQSQSSISQSILSIEKELNLQLFIRDRKRVILTPAGKDLYYSLKPWLNDYHQAVQHAQNIDISNQVNLTIGYSGTPYEYAVIPMIVKLFRQQNPNIKVFLENYAHSVLIDYLKNGNCNLIFTMPDIIKNVEGLTYYNLTNGQYCLIVPHDSNKELKSPIPIDSLTDQSIIFLDHRWCPPTQNKLQQEILHHNNHLNISYVNNISTCHTMVKAGTGLGVWVNFVQDPYDKDLDCLKLKTDIIPKYGVAILDKGTNKAANLFAKWLINNGLPLITKNYL